MQVETTIYPGFSFSDRVCSRMREGFFLESYNQETLRSHGIGTVFMQDNHSKSARGTLRVCTTSYRQPAR